MRGCLLELYNAGVTVAITGDTPKQERIANIERFHKVRHYLVNVAVLTTGFNVPDIDLLALCGQRAVLFCISNHRPRSAPCV